jgi:hypothetical protein
MSFNEIGAPDSSDILHPISKSHFSQEMRRLVDTVESTTNSFVALYAEAQRRAQDFKEKHAKDAIASAEKSARLESRKMRHAVIGLAVSITVAATGFIGSGLNERTKHQRAFETDEFQRKLARLDKISAAITEVRKVKEDTLIDCGTPRYDIRDVTHKRIRAHYELNKVYRNSNYYFGEEVLEALKAFLIWEKSFPDYCSKDLPGAEEWKTRQKDIENLIRKAIKNPL